MSTPSLSVQSARARTAERDGALVAASGGPSVMDGDYFGSESAGTFTMNDIF
jgi:hypothetical protein